jgi:Cysteine-rich CWC
MLIFATNNINHSLWTIDHGLNKMTKHEIIRCERCGTSIECKANSYTKCQCSVVQLNLNEVQYIAENYEGCMCASCLLALQDEYRGMIGIKV